jgi:hypothetical protein
MLGLPSAAVPHDAADQQPPRFGGQCPPNLRIRIVELPTSAKLPRMVLDAFVSSQTRAEVLEKFISRRSTELSRARPVCPIRVFAGQ